MENTNAYTFDETDLNDNNATFECFRCYRQFNRKGCSFLRYSDLLNEYSSNFIQPLCRECCGSYRQDIYCCDCDGEVVTCFACCGECSHVLLPEMRKYKNKTPCLYLRELMTVLHLKDCWILPGTDEYSHTRYNYLTERQKRFIQKLQRPSVINVNTYTKNTVKNYNTFFNESESYNKNIVIEMPTIYDK